MKSVFLIPFLPLLGFLFNFTLGVRVFSRRSEGAPAHPSPIVGLVACGTVLLSFVLSVLAAVQVHGLPNHRLVETFWVWIPGGLTQTIASSAPFQIDWAYQVDPLSSVMILVVTLVGFLIHVYSVGYMGHDPGYARFMAYLNLFMFAMLTLVLGANYAVLFVGWEGVGLCSYLLIGFWFHKQSAADAGKKAFIVNRIGDAFFLLGMFLIFAAFGTLDFTKVMARVADQPVEWAWTGTLTVIGLCLFAGACGKSAQIPLYVWLPDAMEGPTPVSALIHAATMVTAGVYVVARSASLYAHAPQALLVVAVVGMATAVFAATIGLVQNDIKRVLAYSTVSQLGYMFAACGVGAFVAGIFHLVTHAFFKALLFLGSGSVIHGMSGEQDMRKMGGLKDKLPWTHRTMWIGCVAIAGIPPLAGFFSKDEILWSAFRIGGYGRWIFAVGLLTAALTAFYMFRLYHLTFSCSFRGTPEQEHHLHESPPSMIVPLQVLAVGSMVAGLLGFPAVLAKLLRWPNILEHFLDPVFENARETLDFQIFPHLAHGTSLELGLMGGSVVVAVAGIAFAGRLYDHQPEIAERLARTFAAAYRVLLNKYYVDEIYHAVLVRGAVIGGGNALQAIDRYFVDGGDGQVKAGFGVNGVAWWVRDVVAVFSNVWDRLVVDGLVNLTALILDNLSYAFRAVQSGLVQSYALTMLILVLFLIGAARFIPY